MTDAMPESPIPPKVTRANMSSINQQDANYQKASAVRAESDLRKQELTAQRERFRQRGQMLRQQRAHNQQVIKSATAGCQERAHGIGGEARSQRTALRAQREGMQQQWEKHGRQLTAQHMALRARLKSSQEDNQKERFKRASELNKMLKKLNEETDKSILAKNSQSAMRVRMETSPEVVRVSKIAFLDHRWQAADELREKMERLRQRQKQQESEYLAQAHAVRDQARQKHNDEARRREEEHKQRAEQIRAWEKQLEKDAKDSRDAETERKRRLHEEMETAKLVPEEELEGVRSQPANAVSKRIEANALPPPAPAPAPRTRPCTHARPPPPRFALAHAGTHPPIATTPLARTLAHRSPLPAHRSPLSLVPQEESTTGEYGPTAMFARFFGFRKRGSGHHLTSVAL
jgi:hypothetical protein